MRHDEPDFWWKAKVLPPFSSSARWIFTKFAKLVVMPWYTASKFALVGFTQSFAHEMGPHGVTVNAICPGLALTERAIHLASGLAGEGESAEEHLAMMVRERSAANPLGRVTETRDIANMAAFLSSKESDYVTGLAVSVSGGDVMS